MSHDMAAVEATRARFRPNKIMTLFIGESAPWSGAFFYYGNSAMVRHMQGATEPVLGQSSDFLETFKANGWYLDDLVLTPVDHLTSSERKARCHAAKASLAERIAEYQPLAIVTLLLRIKDIVDGASVMAGTTAPRFAVHFPGFGQQGRFREDMGRILHALPRANQTRP